MKSIILSLVLAASAFAENSCHLDRPQDVITPVEQIEAYEAEVGVELAREEIIIDDQEDVFEYSPEMKVDLKKMRDAKNNVILITMDGIRSYEFYRGVSRLLNKKKYKLPAGKTLPYIWNEMIPNGVLYGRRGVKSTFRSADKLGISLPNYQAIFLGHHHGFYLGNGNPRVKQETMFERIKRKLNLSKYEVAAIGSWSGVNRAVAKDANSYLINIGRVPLNDETNDPIIAKLNKDQDVPPPWGSRNKKDRGDSFTWAQSMHYLKKHKPRLMYINLLDVDEFGHNFDYKNYVLSIRWFDQKIKELMNMLDHEMKEYGKKTTVIITTDHSRGFAWLWGGHSIEKNIFLVAKGPHIKHKGRIKHVGKHNHYSIRPTIEMLFGLWPVTPHRPLYHILGAE